MTAGLKKRGQVYYFRLQKKEDGEKIEVCKSLGTKNKRQAFRYLDILEELEHKGIIDPYSRGFDPIKILQRQRKPTYNETIGTMRAAADHFYKKKSYLSQKTINNTSSIKSSKRGAYQRTIEHFIELNDLADTSPRLVEQHHFERIIFKPNIKTATMWFYFRQLRAFWNKLIEWNVVEVNHLKAIKKDMPDKRTNVSEKMISEDELKTIFKTYDDDLERKQSRADWIEGIDQHWFKPLMAVYFYCGLRKHEAVYGDDIPYSGLKGENLIYVNGELALIHLPPTKGHTERAIPIPKDCLHYLESYLEKRGSLKPKDYLFIYLGGSRKGWPVTGQRAYKMFKHYAKLAGLPKERTLHGMRHNRVTTWLEDGYNPAEAQFMAGHSSIKTTQGYTHLTGKNLLEKMKRMEEGK